MCRTDTRLLLLLFTVLLVAGPSAAAVEIRDAAQMFDAASEAKAMETLRRIEAETGTGVLIETFAQIPRELRGRFESTTSRAAFFRDWAEQEAERAGARGVYILVVREPGALHIAADTAARTTLFPKSDRDRVVNAMLPAFKERQFGRGLVAGVEVMRERMLANGGRAGGGTGTTANGGTGGGGSPAGRTDAPAGGTSGLPSCGVGGLGMCIIPLVLVLVAVFVIRGMMARRNLGGPGGPGAYGQGGYGQGGYGQPGYGQPGYGQPGYGAGGGGFGRGVMGGLLGGLGGAWLYDRMTGGGGNEAHGAPPPGVGPTDPSAAPGAGEFGGDTGAGGMFGGTDVESSGDMGGGDFGGDVGGGGEF